MRLVAVFISFLLISPMANSRVFDFKEYTFSSYLRGSFGLTRLQKSAYADSFPTTVTFPNATDVTQMYSGEAGFGFSGQSLTFRIGAELVSPSVTSNAVGKSAAGTEYLSLTSTVWGAIPQGNIEIFVKKWQRGRLYLGGGAGYAIMTLKNEVTMNATGTAVLGIPSYLEEGTGYGIMGQGFFGGEFIVFDNVTMSLDAGYRYLVINAYNSNRDTLTTRGAITQGSTLKNTNGTNRTTDFSGPMGSVAIRIYIR